MERPSGTKTKIIPGLPRTPKVKLDKAPAKRGKSTQVWKGLRLTFSNGWLMEVSNPSGGKAAVWVGQTAYPGFSVYLEKAPYTIIGYGYRHAEKLAIRLALRGHRKVFVKG